ncbi:MAG: redoxin domain-containing protein, partial [Gammaproteobacteria bacterium]
MLLCVLLLGLVFSPVAPAQDHEDIELPGGTAMALTHYKGDGKRLVIWLPSERGLGAGHVPVALGLSDRDVDVWAVDLHGSYLEPTGRQSVRAFEAADLRDLIREAVNRGFERVLVFASGRVAQFALAAGRLWQQERLGSELVGFAFVHPHLIEETFTIGEEAGYVPVARANRWPVLLIQPEYSTKFARTGDISAALSESGGAVFTQALRGVKGGFHARPDNDLEARDFEARERLPAILIRTMNLMARMPTPEPDGRSVDTQADNGTRKHARTSRLHPFSGDPQPPALALEVLDEERTLDLEALKGEVVLVNFWATWCGPCLEEIPSMARLVKRLEGTGFHVLAVNIGEDAERIHAFTKDLGVNFPVLLDRDGEAVRDWKVYAYPSNYLVGRDG